MKKIYYSLICFFLTAFYSCNDCPETIDTSIRVGNILCSDGSFIEPGYLNKDGKKAIGVIFWVNPGNDESVTDLGYAVSLHNLNAVAWSDTILAINNVSVSENDFLGASNTSEISLAGQDGKFQTPAATNSIDFKPEGIPGWFLGSVGQMKELYKQRIIVNESIMTAGGNGFNDIWYWTSTQDGTGGSTSEQFSLIISLTEGTVLNSIKDSHFAIRPIIAIRK